MSERPMPQTDAEWQEWFSACLDGELDEAERRDLERWLTLEPTRARELDELRRLGGALRGWTISAPEPDDIFMRQLCERLQPARAQKENSAIQVRRPSEPSRPQSAFPRESWGDWLRRALLVPWPVAAALFIAGMLAGVGGMKMIPRNQTMVVRVEQPAHPTGAAQVALAEPEPEMPAISAAQAEALRREMQASALRDRILRALDRRDYAAAARDYRQLWENYRGSAALRQLGENPLLRRAAEQFENGGRI